MKTYDLASHAPAGHGLRVKATTHAPAFPTLIRIVRALGLGRGRWKRRHLGPRPERVLELYSYEGCPMCRRVRRTMTELDLDYVHRSCPRGDSANRRELKKRGGKVQVPYLVDHTAEIEMYESTDIIRHLIAAYGGPA